MSDHDPLKTVELALERLHAKEQLTGLDSFDVASLEKLVKLRLLLTGKATEVTETVNTNTISPEDIELILSLNALEPSHLTHTDNKSDKPGSANVIKLVPKEDE